jgi:hypothetical protein
MNMIRIAKVFSTPIKICAITFSVCFSSLESSQLFVRPVKIQHVLFSGDLRDFVTNRKIFCSKTSFRCLDNHHFVIQKISEIWIIYLKSKLEIRERKHAKFCDKTTAVSKVEKIQKDSQFGSLIAIHPKKLQCRSFGTCG